MGGKTWVCTLCSQDFTRKYSAYRHSRDLHQAQGKIVRTIDYVIGRIAGQYQPADPLTYRSKSRQHSSTLTDSDAKSFSFPSISIAHDSQRKYASTSSPNEQFVPSQRLSINSVKASTFSTNGSTKFDELQKSLQTCFDPKIAQVILDQVSIAVINSGGNESILDRCLAILRNSKNTMDAFSHLFGASTTEHSPPPLHNHHVKHLPESTRIKLATIEKRLTNKLKDDATVWEVIKGLINRCNFTNDHTFLDRELEFL
jgi:hypothetical protein